MTRLELSIRENFGHPRRFGPPMLAVGDKLHIGNDAIAELRSRCDGERVLVLIHGYNSDVTEARAAYQDIEGHVLDWYTVVVRCYLPLSRWVPGFWQAWGRADDGGALLRSIFDGLPAASIDVETHSLGARVWAWMFSGAAPVAGQWRNAILTGAAIPQLSLDLGGGKYYRATQNFVRVLVAHSEHDSALKGYEWATLRTVRCLGLRGPTPQSAPCVRGFDCSPTVPNHGGYRHSAQLYGAWKGLLKGKAT